MYWLIIGILTSLLPLPFAHSTTPFNCDPLLVETRSTFMQRPVRGLYESIPGLAQVSAEGMTIVTSSHWSTLPLENDFSSTIIDENNLTLGLIKRSMSADKKTISFLYANLKSYSVAGLRRAPSFINVPGVVPLVEGRGIPLQAFVTLNQMRIAQIPYGNLRRAVTVHIDNIVTALELRKSRAMEAWIKSHLNDDHDLIPGELIADEILATGTGRYINTVLAQSGHQIVGIRIHDVVMRPLYEILSQTDLNHPTIRSLLEGLDIDHEWAPIEFKIEMSLLPAF